MSVQKALATGLDNFFRRFMPAVVGRVSAISTSRYMRNAGGHLAGLEPKRREPGDSGPLRIVTGRLARSLTGGRQGSVTRGAQGGVSEQILTLRQTSPGEWEMVYGSSVPYARTHEEGFTGTVSVPAHTRVLRNGRRVSVRPHTREAATPARPYLGPALREAVPWIQEQGPRILAEEIKKQIDGMEIGP